MSTLPHTVDIDRIVVEGLGLSAQRARQLRFAIEGQLRRRLEDEDMLDGLTSDSRKSSLADEAVIENLVADILQSLLEEKGV